MCIFILNEVKIKLNCFIDLFFVSCFFGVNKIELKIEFAAILSHSFKITLVKQIFKTI